MKLTIDQYVNLSRYSIKTKYNKSYHIDKYEYLKNQLSQIVDKFTDGNVQIYFCYTASVIPEIVELNNKVYIVFDMSLFVIFSELYTLRKFRYRIKQFNYIFFYYNKYFFALSEGENDLAEYLLKKIEGVYKLDLFSSKYLYNEITKCEGIIVISTFFVLFHELGHYIFESKSANSIVVKEKMFEYLHISYESVVETVKSLNISSKEYKKIKTFKELKDTKESICDAWAFVALRCLYSDKISDRTLIDSSIFALTNVFYIKYIQGFIFEYNFIGVDNRIMYLCSFVKNTCFIKISENELKIRKYAKIYGLYQKSINKYFYKFLENLLGHIYIDYYKNNYKVSNCTYKFYGSIEEAIKDLE